jgi:ABC-type uncharacterized transport system substrate-binding protein
VHSDCRPISFPLTFVGDRNAQHAMITSTVRYAPSQELRSVRRFAFAALAIGVAALAIPAGAEVTQADILVAGRAISFIQSLAPGDVRVGIVYDPRVPQSSQQASELATMLADGLRVGVFTLKPVMLPVDKVDSGNIALFFLTEGMGANAENVGRASRKRKIPCITFDFGQVRNGACAIGAHAQPRIEVIVNRAAADASGTALNAVFRMMVKEI